MIIIENDNIDVPNNVIPSTDVEDNDNGSDGQEDDNLSCPENEIINEDNLSNVDSAVGPDNEKTLNILEQERNDFWCTLDYILDLYKKISNIHLKDVILFMPTMSPDSIWSSIEVFSSDFHKQISLYDIQAKVFSSLKPQLSILGSSKDDETKTKITSVTQMLCSTNLDMSRLHRVCAAPFFKREYKKSFLKLPITQQFLFGKDFYKWSEKVVKEQ